MSTQEKANDKTILLAEDDTFISRAYYDGLTRAGYNVLLAKDGAEAVALARSHRPKLILLDVIMPIKNGYEALAELKADDTTKDIPVIIVSNLGQDADLEKGRQLGAVDFLIKSNYSIAEVVEKVRPYAG